jgi:hypothetical protein
MRRIELDDQPQKAMLSVYPGADPKNMRGLRLVVWVKIPGSPW